MTFQMHDRVITKDGEGILLDNGTIAPDRFDDGEGNPIHEKVYRVRFKPHSWSYYLESEIKPTTRPEMTFQEKLEHFRARVEANQLERHNRQGYTFPPPKVTIKPGKKYTKVDVGTSGKFMVTEDGEIFGIKAYGVIHRGHRYGTLDTIDHYWWGEYAPIKGGKPQWRK